MSTAEDSVWTVSDHVEEVRGKHYLKKKDFEAYREGSKYVMDHNDDIIAKMRKANKKKRGYLVNPECGDKHVVQTVFKDDKETKLAYERYTAEKTKVEMTQRALSRVNTLNNAKYMKEKKQRELEKLRQDVEQIKLECDDNASPEIQSAAKTYTMLENGLDKAVIKNETARLITRQYREILQHLTREHLEMPAKLTKMEQTLAQQKKELEELHSMARGAEVSRDQAKQMLADVEQQTMADIKQRGELLQATRKEVERRGQENELVDKRGGRTLLITAPQEKRDSHVMIQRRENQRTIFTYEDAFLRIKEASHEADIEGVVERVITQKDTNTSLNNKVHELESLTKRMKEDRTKLSEQYRDMKYSGGAKLSRGEKLLEDMEGKIESQEEKKKELEEGLQNNGGCFINIKNGIFTLQEKLRDVKLKAPQHNFTKGDVLDQLDLCSKKLNQLLKDLNADTVVAALSQINEPYFRNFLETHLREVDDLTVLRRHKSDIHLTHNYDKQENEVLSSQDIKKAAKALIDSKVRPRKIKPKKK